MCIYDDENKGANGEGGKKAKEGIERVQDGKRFGWKARFAATTRKSSTAPRTHVQLGRVARGVCRSGSARKPLTRACKLSSFHWPMGGNCA